MLQSAKHFKDKGQGENKKPIRVKRMFEQGGRGAYKDCVCDFSLSLSPVSVLADFWQSGQVFSTPRGQRGLVSPGSTLLYLLAYILQLLCETGEILIARTSVRNVFSLFTLHLLKKSAIDM